MHAGPGALITVELLADPRLTRQNKLVGNILGISNFLPKVFSSVHVKLYIGNALQILSKSENNSIQISQGEVLKIFVGSNQTLGEIKNVKEVNSG